MVLDGLPPVVIICLGDENEDSIAAYIESDIVLHNKTGRFFVLLPELSENDAEGVIARVLKLAAASEDCGAEISFVTDSIMP